MYSCIRYVIRPLKRGGDILYAQDYNTDTHLPRFRKVYELSGPVEIASLGYHVFDPVSVDPPLIFTTFKVYAKGRFEMNNSSTAPWEVELTFGLNLVLGDNFRTSSVKLIDALGLESGSSVSADFYTADVLRLGSLLTDTLEASLYLKVVNANTGTYQTGVSATLRDVVIYLEA